MKAGVRALLVIGILVLWTGLSAPFANYVRAQTETEARGRLNFAMFFPASVRSEPVTGQMLLMISRTNDPEVRLQEYYEFVGVRVDNLKSGEIVAVDERNAAYPLRSLRELPPGDYYVQAYLKVYTKYSRSDGREIWALDQWNGQEIGNSPGDLYSDVQRISIGSTHADTIKLSLALAHTVPSRATLDSEWTKHIKIKSDLLSRFWGQPIYLGATVLLPKGYTSHPTLRYPVIYQQQIVFSFDEARGPFNFTQEKPPESEASRTRRKENGHEETGYEFYQSWISENFPRVIAVRLLHPTPYADASGMTNSANNGPYRDAITKELIPYIEQHFRTLPDPSDRILVGNNLGGRDALTLQLFNPEAFGGAWIFYPWPFDFRHYFGVNIYEDKSAYEVDPSDVRPEYVSPWWRPPERMIGRNVRDGQAFLTNRDLNRHDLMLTTRWPGGELGINDAAFSPVANDGYPKSLWNKSTGEIDRGVADYWRDHGDLAQYVRSHWSSIGPRLIGKLHFYVGDEDDYLRNYSVYSLDDFLSSAQPRYGGSFEYGHRKGKDWQPMTNAELIKQIAEYIKENAPPGTDQSWRH